MDGQSELNRHSAWMQTHLKVSEKLWTTHKIGNSLVLPQSGDTEQGMCMHFQLLHDKCCSPLWATPSSTPHPHISVLFGDIDHHQIPIEGNKCNCNKAMSISKQDWLILNIHWHYLFRPLLALSSILAVNKSFGKKWQRNFVIKSIKNEMLGYKSAEKSYMLLNRWNKIYFGG